MNYYNNIRNLVVEYRLLLLFMVLAAFTFGELYRHIIGLLGLVGVYYILRHPLQWRSSIELRTFSLLFVLLWLPAVLSLVDAEFLKPSLSAVVRYLFYFFAGVMLISMSGGAIRLNRLNLFVGVLLSLWMMDGVYQLVFGVNVFGMPSDGQRLTGVFYPWPHLGFVLAVFAPVFFDFVRELAARVAWSWLLLIPYLVVVLFGGGRSSWILLAFSSLSYLVMLVWAGRVQPLKWLLRFVIIATIAVIMVMQTPWLKQRFTIVSGLVSGDYTAANQATSDRLPIWQTALHMAGERWVNGVGVRAFRYAYDEYADEDNSWRHHNTGHPHLFILEIGAEAGGIGLLGYVLFCMLLARIVCQQAGRHNYRAASWGITGMTAAFPLSSTVAFYSPFSSALLWLSIIVLMCFYRQSPQPVAGTV